MNIFTQVHKNRNIRGFKKQIKYIIVKISNNEINVCILIYLIMRHMKKAYLMFGLYSVISNNSS